MTAWVYLALALALIGLALIVYGLWKFLDNQPFATLSVNGEVGMAIDIDINVPATVEFQALDADNNPVVLPDSVAVTFSAEPASAGDFTSTGNLTATFLPVEAGGVILRGRAEYEGVEYIAVAVVNVKVAIASVRLLVNGQVEPTP